MDPSDSLSQIQHIPKVVKERFTEPLRKTFAQGEPLARDNFEPDFRLLFGLPEAVLHNCMSSLPYTPPYFLSVLPNV